MKRLQRAYVRLEQVMTASAPTSTIRCNVVRLSCPIRLRQLCWRPRLFGVPNRNGPPVGLKKSLGKPTPLPSHPMGVAPSMGGQRLQKAGNRTLALPSRADMEVVWPAPYLRAVSREGGPRLCQWDPSVRRPEATARHALLCGGLVRLAEDR